MSNVNFSTSTPAAPSGAVNVAFQTDGANVSANVVPGTGLTVTSGALAVDTTSIASQSWANATFATLASFTSSLGDSGYQQFANGLILQWGSGNAPTGNGDVIAFTQPFPHNVFLIFGQDGGSPSGTPSSNCNSVSAMFIPTGPQYLTSFRVFAKAVTTGAYANTNVNWIALGA